MKKYKNFIKINETSYYSVLDELDIDDNMLKSYFSNNYSFSEWHTIDMTPLNYFMNFIDENQLDKDMYYDFKEMLFQNDEDEDEIKEFLKSFKTDTYKYNEKINGYYEKINELFKKNIIDELDKDDYVSEIDFKEEIDKYNNYTYEDKIDKLDVYDLKNIINWDDYAIVKWESWYDGSGIVWLEQIYGDFTSSNKNKYNYNSEKEKFESIKNYIDWNKFDKALEMDFDFSYKEEWYKDQIMYDDNEINKLFNYNNRNSYLLFDMMNNNSSLGKTEKFQESYIHEYIIDMYSEKLENLNNDDKKEGLKNVLIEIEIKFGLNNNIEKKYKEYLGPVKARKFNL